MSFHLDKDEYVVHEARRSWVIVFGETIGLIFSILIPLFIYTLFESIATVQISGNQTAFFMIIMFSWIFVVWNIIFLIWSEHYLDIMVITNKNLIDIEQKGIWSREVSILSLDKIQDVTTEVDGFVPTVLGFGDIHIQTAGIEKEVVVKKINNPNFVRSKIKEVCDKEHGKI